MEWYITFDEKIKQEEGLYFNTYKEAELFIMKHGITETFNIWIESINDWHDYVTDRDKLMSKYLILENENNFDSIECLYCYKSSNTNEWNNISLKTFGRDIINVQVAHLLKKEIKYICPKCKTTCSNKTDMVWL